MQMTPTKKSYSWLTTSTTKYHNNRKEQVEITAAGATAAVTAYTVFEGLPLSVALCLAVA